MTSSIFTRLRILYPTGLLSVAVAACILLSVVPAQARFPGPHPRADEEQVSQDGQPPSVEQETAQDQDAAEDPDADRQDNVMGVTHENIFVGQDPVSGDSVWIVAPPPSADDQGQGVDSMDVEIHIGQ